MATVWLSGGGGAVLEIDGVGVLDAEAPNYDVQAVQLMPHGRAWSRRPESYMRGLVEAGARSFARVHTALDWLREEIWPDSADESIAAWEKFAGLPGCGEPPVELEDRRLAVVAKLFRSRGPLSRLRAEAVAAELGYSSFTWQQTYLPFKCGSRCGARLQGGGGGWQWHAAFIVSPANPALDDTLRCIVTNAIHSHFTLTVITEP